MNNTNTLSIAQVTPITKVTVTKKRTRNSVKKSVTQMGVVDQVKVAFAQRNLFATMCGFVFGGFVPVATFVVGHFAVPVNQWFYILVAGGLLFSAKTVFDWGRIAFHNTAKAVGFVVLIEGVMTFVPIHALAVAALVILVLINGVSTGVVLVQNSRDAR